MEFTRGYMCVLTVLCSLPLIFHTTGLFTNAWVIYGNEETRGPVAHATVTAHLGLWKSSYCIEQNNTDVSALNMCSTTSNQDLVNMFTWIKQSLDMSSPKSAAISKWLEFQTKTIADTFLRIQILAVSGEVLAIIGFVLGMLFWRKSFQRCFRLRWILCNLSWLLAGVLILTAAFIALQVNKDVLHQLHDFANSTNEIERIYGRVSHVKLSSPWALVLSGVGGFHGIVASFFVLIGKCFMKKSQFRKGSLSKKTSLQLDDFTHDGKTPLLLSQEDDDNETPLYI